MASLRMAVEVSASDWSTFNRAGQRHAPVHGVYVVAVDPNTSDGRRRTGFCDRLRGKIRWQQEPSQCYGRYYCCCSHDLVTCADRNHAPVAYFTARMASVALACVVARCHRFRCIRHGSPVCDDENELTTVRYGIAYPNDRTRRCGSTQRRESPAAAPFRIRGHIPFLLKRWRADVRYQYSADGRPPVRGILFQPIHGASEHSCTGAVPHISFHIWPS